MVHRVVTILGLAAKKVMILNNFAIAIINLYNVLSCLFPFNTFASSSHTLTKDC